MADADAYAKNDAYGKLCMAAGGKTSSMTKTYSSEGENSRTQLNERATKSACPGVDMTGVQQEQIKRVVTPNGKFNTYVLIALPTGEANILKKAKEAHAEREAAGKRAPEAFKELDEPAVEKKPVSSVSSIELMPVDNVEYKTRRDAALQKPGAVIGHVTISN
jgi:hypothetical protein